MKELRKCFKNHPVIASVRNDVDFEYALNSKVATLFILGGDIFNLPQIMKECKKDNKLVFLHMELIKGIGRDRESNLIEVTKKEGLIAIQPLFLLDSSALKTREQLLKHNQPDAVEILPGIAAPYLIEHYLQRFAMSGCRWWADFQ